MQSSNYVPGVSGWKIDPASGAFEMASDRVAVVGTDPKATYSGRSQPKEPNPFVVIDGAVYISQAEVERASITGAKIADMWSVKMQVNAQGQYMAAGIGPGIQEKQPTEFEKALAKGAGAVLEFLARAISDTQLGAELKGRAPSSIAELVRDAIRDEIRLGGLLHRN
jgi:hypothetical protein